MLCSLYIITDVSEELGVSNLILDETYSSVLKMEAALSGETLLTVYQATRRHISEDSNLHITAGRTSSLA
jgi:hypothetical protein